MGETDEVMAEGQTSEAWNFGGSAGIGYLRIGFSCNGEPQVKMHGDGFQAVFIISTDNPKEWKLTYWDDFRNNEPIPKKEKP